MNPEVSVVVPTYNGAAFLEETLTSLSRQTYASWEAIVVDDASTDETFRIVQAFASQDRRFVPLKLTTNGGVAHARNVAIEHAKGRYIAFLDHDDLWHPKKLALQLAHMRRTSSLFSYTSYEIIDDSGKVVGAYHAPQKTAYEDMLRTSTIGTSTMLYDASKLGKHPFLSIGHEDYAWKLQLLKKTAYATGMADMLVRYRKHSQSLSRDKFKAARWQWHIYKNIERLPLHRRIYYFAHYAYFGVRK